MLISKFRGIPYRTTWSHPIEFIPEIVLKDADTIISSIKMGTVTYSNPVDDPVFSAHHEITITDISNARNRTMYTPDAVAAVIGCTEQVCAFTLLSPHMLEC